MAPFVGLWDIHYGSDTRRGARGVAHDQRLLDAVLKFVSDYKPKLLVLGGDQLNCGPISHWLKDKRRAQEGIRWTDEVAGFDEDVLSPLEEALPKGAQKVWLDGNHCDWVNDLLDKHPELDSKDGSVLHHSRLLDLKRRGWRYIEQGGHFKAGHLYFIHGDIIRGGQNIAKQAVERSGHNIRLGHHHTFQSFTHTSTVDVRERKTGIAVPCLGALNPAFMENAPNRWVQGFLHGYIHDDGTFADYVSIATNGKFTVNGKVYKG